MITFKCLTSEDFEQLYKCFLAAFSDYVVSMAVSREQFQQRLVRDGVDVEMSVAAFDNGEMVAFSLNASGEWQGLTTAYDSGTGVIPSHRGAGIGKNLFAYMFEVLLARGISQCLLEVISTNAPAVRLYEKLGFEHTRRLAVLLTEAMSYSDRKQLGFEMRKLTTFDWNTLSSFWDGNPSWQNAIDSVTRAKNYCRAIGAYEADSCIGYGIVYEPAGNLMQLAVHPNHRRKGVGSSILRDLQSELAAPLKVINIDYELTDTLRFYQSRGFKVVLDQFEMIKKLKNSRSRIDHG
jgi:ribosomal protein S18 acetylase RimI-like enzyme